MTLFPIALLLLLAQEATVERDIVYDRPAEGQELRLDIHKPAGVGPHPTVIMIHGGGWVSGRKEDMDPFAKMFADNGIAVVNIQYRLAPKNRWPSMIEDAQTAVRWTRENGAKYGLGTDRIGAVGASAGAHLAMLLGTTDTPVGDVRVAPKESSRVQAVGSIFGPTDLTQDIPRAMEVLFPMVLGVKRESADPTVLRNGSPYYLVCEKTAPMFLIHGTRDTIVPIAHSKRMEERLRSNKIPVEVRYIEGMGHEYSSKPEQQKQAMDELMKWLKKNLAPLPVR
jgi:acetyl esterase/lipase